MVCKASCAHGAPPTSPPTGLSCLKRHHDPWCFTRCCGSSSLVFLPKDTERHTPHPAAAILHISQATFCMLPKRRPDPTVTEYSLEILSAANQRAQQGSAQLPQSPAGHRGDAGLVPSMAPGRALQALLPQPLQLVFADPQLLPCLFPFPGYTWPCANWHVHTRRRGQGPCVWCMAVYKQPLCPGQNPPLREGVRIARVEIPVQACIAALIL